FELARNSSLRGRPLVGDGKLAIAPGSGRDAHVEVSGGANQLSLNRNSGRHGDVLGFALDARDPAALDARLGGRLRANGKIAGTWDRPTLAVTPNGDRPSLRPTLAPAERRLA